MDALTRDTEIAPSNGRTRRWAAALFLAALTVAIGAGIWFWPVKPATRKAEADPVIPVVTAVAEQRDVPVWLDGLGTVQAFQTVIVRSMVDGPLIDIAFKEGQAVRAGDVLARIDPRIYQASLDSAVAKKALDEANLSNAKVDLARYQKLAATNYTTAQQADTQKALVAQLEAQIRQDQAQIDTAATQLSYTTIVSPLNGTVGIRQVDRGNIVHASDAGGLLVITQLQPISVIFSLAQQDLPRVAAAMANGTNVEVLARSEGAVLDRGTLTVLDNQIDSATGTIKLKAAFPNLEQKLWPGGFVGVRLRADTLRGAILVPRAAVQRGPRENFVYVIGADNIAHRVNVVTGYEDELGSVLTSGVAAGDQVVVDGASRITDGGKVSVVPSEAAAQDRVRPSAPGTRRD